MKFVSVDVLLFICLETVLGLKCLRCNEVYNPILCNYITTCSAGEICAVEKVRNENGQVRYNLGCKLKTTCQDFKNLTGKTSRFRSAHSSTYTTQCEECCEQDVCNSVGCGATGYPLDFGPVCLSCENIDNPNNCDKIKACEQNEVCYIEENVLFHMKLFTAKCIQKHVCDPTNGDIFGRRKRNAAAKVKRSSILCTRCCNSTICNNHCGKDKFTTQTSSPIVTSTTVPTITTTSGGIKFSVTFTTCGMTGPYGPNLANCYNHTKWPMNLTAYNVILGIQEWLVPETGYYKIDAYGAAGGKGNNVSGNILSLGGKGARIQGTFYLNAATVLNVAVGQKGVDGGSSEPAGGGGGSFIYTGSIGGSGLLIAAGGGGGGGEEDTHNGYDALGTNQSQNAYGLINQNIGYGGASGNVTVAGAGWKSNGGRHLGSELGYPGKRWYGGDTKGSLTGSGGFGGGGSGCVTNGGGGGGGYTGGSGVTATIRTMWGGSGAGSFNSGTSQINLGGNNTGDGYVVITKL